MPFNLVKLGCLYDFKFIELGFLLYKTFPVQETLSENALEFLGALNSRLHLIATQGVILFLTQGEVE